MSSWRQVAYRLAQNQKLRPSILDPDFHHWTEAIFSLHTWLFYLVTCSVLPCSCFFLYESAACLVVGAQSLAECSCTSHVSNYMSHHLLGSWPSSFLSLAPRYQICKLWRSGVSLIGIRSTRCLLEDKVSSSISHHPSTLGQIEVQTSSIYLDSCSVANLPTWELWCYF